MFPVRYAWAVPPRSAAIALDAETGVVTVNFPGLAPAESVGPEYLKRFFLFHERELLNYAPGLTLEDLQTACTCLIFRNLLPVGLFIYTEEAPEIRVHLDYVAEAISAVSRG